MRAAREAGIKRLFDILVSLTLLILLGLPMLLLALITRLALGSPVLFVQQRPGLHGQPFRILKFRTMRDATDAAGNPLPDEQRMTRYGSFLRRTSLDELPELLNVLRGDMSLVGPRPLLMEYLPLYSEYQARRHEVRPGITGYSQVNGRNAVDWDTRFEMDVWYVDQRSFWLDLKILVQTAFTVVGGAGVRQEGHVTMEPFTGSKPCGN